MQERSFRPHNIVVQHDNRRIALGQSLHILHDPAGIPVGQIAERFRVCARRRQQKIPAEQVDQARHTGNVHTVHIDGVVPERALFAVTAVEHRHRFGFVNRAQRFPGIKPEHVVFVFEHALPHFAEIGTARRIHGVAPYPYNTGRKHRG